MQIKTPPIPVMAHGSGRFDQSGSDRSFPGHSSQEGRNRRAAPAVHVIDSRNPEALKAQGQSPAQFWRSSNGGIDPDQHVAPPSIMQIKISQMLDAQDVQEDAQELQDVQSVSEKKSTPSSDETKQVDFRTDEEELPEQMPEERPIRANAREDSQVGYAQAARIISEPVTEVQTLYAV